MTGQSQSPPDKTDSEDGSINAVSDAVCPHPDQLQVFATFATALNGFSDKRQLLDHVANCVAGPLGFANCAIYARDQDRPVLRPFARCGDVGPLDHIAIDMTEIAVGQGVPGSVADSGEPQRIDDSAATAQGATSDDASNAASNAAAGSEICVPIHVDGAVFGVIHCRDSRPAQYTMHDLATLTTIAAMTGAKLALLKQARQLRESEKTHRAIFDNLTDSFCRTDRDDCIVMVSPSAELLFGYTIAELTGMHFSKLYYRPKDREGFLNALKENGGSITAYDIEFRHKDGHKLWCANSSSYYYDDDGQILGIEGITRNIAPKKQSEFELARAQKQLLKAQSIALLGSWEYDVENNRMDWSEETFRILGIDPSGRHISNSAFLNAVHPADRDNVQQTHRMAVKTGTPFSVTFRYFLPDGQMKWIYEECEVEVNAAGRAAILFGILHDITQRMQLEQQLQQSLTEAKEANQVKSDFLATMSHELRTPLNAILGFAEIITGTYFGPIGDPRYRDYAENILTSGHYLLELINDLLDLSKIEAGAYQLQFETLSFTELAEECLAVIRHRADETGVRLSVDIQPPHTDILADKRAVKQILLNLLSNALKFTRSGGSITISGHTENDRYLVKVSDTGDGIAPDILPLLGEPFCTAAKVPYHASEGTGLGLTICKALVQLHDGAVSIDSTLGKGTTVGFTLPIQSPAP